MGGRSAEPLCALAPALVTCAGPFGLQAHAEGAGGGWKPSRGREEGGPGPWSGVRELSCPSICPSVQGRGGGRRLQPHEARAEVVPVWLLQEAQGEGWRESAGLWPSQRSTSPSLAPTHGPGHPLPTGPWRITPQWPQARRDELRALTCCRGRWGCPGPQRGSQPSREQPPQTVGRPRRFPPWTSGHPWDPGFQSWSPF